MKRSLARCVALAVALSSFTPLSRTSEAADDKARQIPDALQPWVKWALWDEKDRDCPANYQDPKKRLCFWPSQLDLRVEKAGAHFSLGVTVYHESWVPLPGGKDLWPQTVKANGTAVPVVEHAGAPAVHLEAGTVKLEGDYPWEDIPQRISVPREIGILALTLDGKPVENPVWDAEGFLWLKRDGSKEETDKNFLSLKLYAALEDGIPLWLRTEVELTVAGKSREEDLSAILPEGWKLASVDSAIPVAIDDSGRMKAQVRAGKWTVQLSAFRFDNPKELHYAPGAKPAAEDELVAFRSKPDLRIVEIIGPPSIDVSQATFPEKWRELPVYRWDTSTKLQIDERMRGMGQQKPAGLSITRQWWLDEDGRGLTFQDHLTGAMQQIWRLDAAPGQDLGSVRSSGQGQLVTRNPQNGAPGVEIRSRSLDLEATGRNTGLGALSAVGWQANADSVNVTLNLPPGWRLFALFGADWVQGDWLTSWTLLDLFLLLVFSLAVYRLFGFAAAALAFVAFGLSFHEVGAPRYTWLVLLAPLALLRAPLEGRALGLIRALKWVALAILLLYLVPFIARQVQQALYPQLEIRPASERSANNAERTAAFASEPAPSAPPADASPTEGFSISRGREYKSKSNMLYDAKARIQTGPGVPDWNWRSVSFGWNGPVLASQNVRPILISLTFERLLTIVRVVFLVLLTGALLGVRRTGKFAFPGPTKPTAAAVVLCLLFFGLTSSVHADTAIPNQATLDTLRDRLHESADAFPNAAEIPTVSLKLAGSNLTIDAEVHAAARVAVPLPGRLPAWSPVNVLVDEKPEVALRRDDGYLWVVLTPGVHRVRVAGQLANVTEWEWTFLLKPRQVKIEAPDWTYSGVRPGGLPEQQVFFALKQKTIAGQASYERPDVQSIALVERTLELGLIWQAHTTVTRLSPPGKAVSLRVPLLPGENVLTPNAVVKDGVIEIRLGAQEKTAFWESGLSIVEKLTLATRADDAWVERWRLAASPVWNVAIAGLPPTFEADKEELTPVWQPWPGEEATFSMSRPEAVPGATVTVHKVREKLTLGKRQRVTNLELNLQCSVGEDFLLELPPGADISSLTENNKALPVRKDGARVVIPLHPGEQAVSIVWRTNATLGFRAAADAIRLPVQSANVSAEIDVSKDRWTLAAYGPQRGPAVRFWVILICSILAALALGRAPASPLSKIEWVLLVIGLTQVPLPAALVVIGWLFLLAWRGSSASLVQWAAWRFNFLQLVIIFLTVCSIGVIIAAVGEGLLGRPEMFVTGNGSSETALRWFQPRSETLLPQPGCLTISIWWYRFLMLVWALWLAAALIRWLRTGWQNFSAGGCFRKSEGKKTSATAKAETRATTPPPPLPEGN